MEHVYKIIGIALRVFFLPLIVIGLGSLIFAIVKGLVDINLM